MILEIQILPDQDGMSNLASVPKPKGTLTKWRLMRKRSLLGGFRVMLVVIIVP